jgi:beta-glucosidase
MPRPLPPGFTLGVATSSYQIEGAHDVGGRGPSIWDTFCRTPGKVEGGDTGDVACDHFHRYPEDVDLLRELGVDAYRLSVAWPRIFPTGHEHAPNAKGLDFYARLVDALLEAGIEPWLTLYHWDLPQGLEDRGGWRSRETVDHFARFADAMSRHLGDRVGHWITHNEPWCAAILGHVEGHHAPGLTDWGAGLAAAHHLLLSHGRAVPVLRGNAPDAKVGITLNLVPAFPASPSAADADAARHFDGYFNRWFLDPCFGRPYPEDMVADYRRLGRLPAGPLPFLRDGDIAEIGAPIDFLGVNYYSPAVLRSESVPEADNEPRTLHEPPDEARTAMGWPVDADGLRVLLRRVARDCPGVPLVITENGSAWDDVPDADGFVQDDRRRAFLHDHLAACLDAVDEEVPLEGYFAWSLMDNFEWAYGYGKRFGLVRVEYGTQRRVVKASGRWLQRVARGRVLMPTQG